MKTYKKLHDIESNFGLGSGTNVVRSMMHVYAKTGDTKKCIKLLNKRNEFTDIPTQFSWKDTRSLYRSVFESLLTKLVLDKHEAMSKEKLDKLYQSMFFHLLVFALF